MYAVGDGTDATTITGKGQWAEGSIYAIRADFRTNPFRSISILWCEQEIVGENWVYSYNQTDNLVSPWDIELSEYCSIEDVHPPTLPRALKIGCPSPIAILLYLYKLDYADGFKICMQDVSEFCAIFPDQADQLDLLQLSTWCNNGKYSDGDGLGLSVLFADLYHMIRNAKQYNSSNINFLPWRLCDAFEATVNWLETSLSLSSTGKVLKQTQSKGQTRVPTSSTVSSVHNSNTHHMVTADDIGLDVGCKAKRRRKGGNSIESSSSSKCTDNSGMLKKPFIPRKQRLSDAIFTPCSQHSPTVPSASVVTPPDVDSSASLVGMRIGNGTVTCTSLNPSNSKRGKKRITAAGIASSMPSVATNATTANVATATRCTPANFPSQQPNQLSDSDHMITSQPSIAATAKKSSSSSSASPSSKNGPAGSNTNSNASSVPDVAMSGVTTSNKYHDMHVEGSLGLSSQPMEI